MPLPEQPPPDAPAPPPGPEALKSRAKMTLIYWIGGLSILGLMLMFAGAPLLLRSKVSADRTEALNNIRQIGLALSDFEMDYGTFPAAATIPDVKATTSTSLTLDDSSSNKLFRQLIASGLKSEKPFYARAPGCRRPDNIFNSEATALCKGECAFSYVVDLNSSVNPSLPLVMTPMAWGTRSFYRPKHFGDKAIILHVDYSATVMQVRPDGAVTLGGGLTLFDPKVWGGVKPDLRWQE